MHRLVHPQALGIGPVEHARTDEGHRFLVGQGHELDILGVALRLDFLDEFGQRIADPGNHHRPALDAAQPVDALFLGAQLDQVFDAVLARLLDQALDLDRPRAGLERVRVLGRVGLVGAELVVVVVARRVLVVAELLHGLGTGDRRLGARQGRQLVGPRGLRQRLAPGPTRERGTGGAGGQQLQQVAPAFVGGTRRDLAAMRVDEAVVTGADQHGGAPFKSCYSA